MSSTFQMPLMLSILCGILLVLCVMIAITCLLVHHNKQLQQLQYEVKESQTQRRRNTQRKPQGKVVDDGYIPPKEIRHPPTVIPRPNKFYHQRPSASYIEPNNTQYENISIGAESDHSYESLGKFRA